MTKRKALKIVTSLTGAFEPESTVCLHLPNDVNDERVVDRNVETILIPRQVLYPVIVLGILASKCRWTGTNIAYTAYELEHHFRTSFTSYVITLPECRKVVEAASENLGWNIEIILFTNILHENPLLNVPHRDPARLEEGLYTVTNRDGVPLALRSLHDLLGPLDKENLRSKVESVGPDQIAVLQSTSGTTGLPKMAARTHRALISESKAIEDDNSRKPYVVRRLFCTPIFHAFSFPEMVITALRLGIPTFFMRRYDVTFAQKVHDYGITEIAAPPPMLKMLQETTEVHHLLQSIRTIFSGGAPLVPELRRLTLDIFEQPPRIVQVWGMTEGGWFSTFKYPEDDSTGSVGRIVPGLKIRVDPDETLEMQNSVQAGELLIKGEQLMTEYFDNKQASKDAFDNGWLRTGDIGFVKDGKVYFIDRCKDLIKVNGFQVAPAEIEAAVLELPGISDAGAVAVGHGVNEHPLLFVVLSHGEDISKDVIVNHLLSRMARHKVARMEVESIESIPRNPSGKILRKALKERANQRVLRGQR